MVKGLILTGCDTELLLDAYESVALSISQISSRHFAETQTPTVCNRLTKLRKAGYLAKTRVSFVLYRGNPREVGTLYQVTRQAIHYLRVRYPDARFRDEPPRVHFSTLAHDLLLSDTMHALRRRFPQARLTHGKLLGVPSRLGERGPDAVMEGASGGERVAIELELTTKSELRYRHIVLQYQLSQEFDFVLYVTGSQEATAKLKARIIGFKPVPGLPESATGKFYFVKLDPLLKDPSTAAISNGSPQSVQLAA